MKTTEQKAIQFYYKIMGNVIGRMYFRLTMDGYYANRTAKRMMTAKEFNEDDILVDVASGMGGFLIRLAREIKFKHPLVGLDLSPQMVAYLSARLEKENISNTKVIEGSALKLNQYVDKATKITSNWMIKHLDDDDLMQFLEEAKKVLTPGGRFYVCEFTPGPKLFKSVAKAMGFLRTKEEMITALKTVGFVDIQEKNYAGPTHFPLGTVSLSAAKPLRDTIN